RLSPIGNPTDSPVVRINWKFYRKELLLLIYEGEQYEEQNDYVDFSAILNDTCRL
ncbi:hypothetical protein ABH966_004474, partial [Lysinibacillus sp. RC46]